MKDRAAREPGGEPQRLDKWLWAARFFKTRHLAAEAITGGKVQVGEQRVKPARLIRPGDRIRIRKGARLWEVIVQGVSRQRGPAPQAMLLYEETPASKAARAVATERRTETSMPRFPAPGRPTKRDRRKLDQLKGR